MKLSLTVTSIYNCNKRLSSTFIENLLHLEISNLGTRVIGNWNYLLLSCSRTRVLPSFLLPEREREWLITG